MRLTPLLLAATAIAFSACSSGGGLTSTPMPPLSSTNNASSGAESPAQGPQRSAVGDAGLSALTIYTMSNESARNVVEGYAAQNGTFQRVRPADTRGRGDPSIAGTVQGSLAISSNGHFLFAVDAGSNEITSFRMGTTGLSFVDKVNSKGLQPVSLAVHDDLLYVLNARSGEITGFRIEATGKLKHVPNSTQRLSGNNVAVGPAEISFDPTGQILVVTEKMTNRIDTYTVVNGVAGPPAVHLSAGATPFGFAFVPNGQTMVVSDAFHGASGQGAASSYHVALQTGFQPISKAVPDANTAPCWVVITADGSIAFTSNTGNNTISAYSIDPAGRLTLTTGNGVSAITGKSPTDLALSPDNRFLFVINLKSGYLGVYGVGANGKLRTLSNGPLLPENALGLAAAPTL